MKDLVRDTRLTLINRIPVMILSLMSMTLLTRWLGPEGNGVYTFIFANINILLLLFGLQTENAVIHFVSKSNEDSSAESSLALIAVAVSTLLCGWLLFLISQFSTEVTPWIAPPGQPFVYFFWFIFLSFLFRKSLNTALSILRARLKFRLYNRLQLWAQIIPALLYLFGFLWMSRAEVSHDLITVFNVILIGQGSIAAMALVVSYPKAGITFQVRPLIRPFLTFSLKSTLDGIAKFINRRIDVYFVQAFRGTASLGHYGLAAQINNFAQEIIHPFTQVMNPYLVKADPLNRIQMVSRMSRIILSVTTLLCILIVVTAPWIVPLIFGQAFKAAVAATQILAVSIIISTSRLIFSGYFQSVNRLHVNIQSNWLGVIMTLVLDILLIPAFGIEGAAMASIIAYASSLVYIFYHFKKVSGLPFTEFLFIKKSDLLWLQEKDRAS